MMRRSVLLIALLATGCASSGQMPSANVTRTYTNPIIHADYSDPDVIRAGDAYYMVASSFHFSPGIPVLKSRDLVHWTIIGHVLPRLPFGPLYDMPGPHTLDDTKSKPIGGSKYASGVWAPSIRFHEGKFWVFWATPDEGVFRSTAINPAGPWTEPVQILSGPGYEDPCPFWDDDGRAWLIHGKVGAGPLILYPMDWEATRVLDKGTVVAEDKIRLPILEGPKFIKREGWYYIFAPIGGVPTGPQSVGRSRQITGPYEWRDVLLPGNGLAGPHQGGYVETPNGEGWFAHFNSTGAFGRIVHLQPVVWRDGWPVMGAAEGHATGGIPVLTHRVPETGADGPADKLQDSDDFSNQTLGLQWSWNHNPDDTRWSLNERKGWLRLRADEAQHIVNARNTLTQILQGPERQFVTRLDPSRMSDGQRAGLSLFGVRPAWIGVTQDGEARRITLSREGVETHSDPISGPVELRAIVRADQAVRYAWRPVGERTWRPMGGTIPLSTFSWWKGSRPALFSFTRGIAGGIADFDFMTVTLPGDTDQ